MDENSIKLESLDRSGSSENQVLDTSQIIDATQSNGMVSSQMSTSGVQLVQTSQATSVSLPWVVPPYQMMLLPAGMSPNLFNNGNVLTLQDGHVLVTPYSDSGQINEATVQMLQQQQQQQQNQATSLMTQKLESELIQQQLSVTESQILNTQPQTPIQKTEKPKLPKKPLNTYMMFSKAIWPQVKAANSHLSSVTEIGAIVGAIWRELDASQKQQYNEYFIKDKERYENELRAYRQMTGLSETDALKPPKPKRCKDTKTLQTTTNQQSWQNINNKQNNQHLVNNNSNNVNSNTSTPLLNQDSLRQAAESLSADQQLAQQMLAQAGLTATGVSPTGQLLLTNSDGSFIDSNNIVNFLALHSQSLQLIPNIQVANSGDRQLENDISTDQASWLWQAKLEGQADGTGNLLQEAVIGGDSQKDGTIYYDEHNKQFIYKTENGLNTTLLTSVDQSNLIGGSDMSREQMEAELQQLKSALSEKTSQVQALTLKLEEAKQIIEHYQQQITAAAVAAVCNENNNLLASTMMDEANNNNNTNSASSSVVVSDELTTSPSSK